MELSGDSMANSAHIECTWQRLRYAAFWLLTLTVRPSLHGNFGAYPQAYAVVDDFGSLVIVGNPVGTERGWA